MRTPLPDDVHQRGGRQDGDGTVQGALSRSSRSIKLDELVLLLRLSLRMSANQSGISASGVLGVDMPEGGL